MKWTPEADQIVIKLYTNVNKEKILKFLPNNSWSSITQRARKFKIFRPREFQFTDEQVHYLINNYPTTTDSELAKYIGCTIPMARHKCKTLGLKKNLDYILCKCTELGEKLGEAGAGNRFKKGHIPANKGKKMEEFMTPEVLAKFKSNQYKKGRKPENWLPVGSEAITRDGYIQVKIAEGMFQWRLKHRLVWEEHNGPIPVGHNIQFKDSNRLNCDIDNLYIISKQKQCGTQNSIHRYPPEVKKAIRILGKLNKQIEKYETN